MNMTFSQDRGFTLMELLVTMIIIGLLGAIAAPNLNRVFSKNKLRGDTTSVTTSLYMARLKAINDGEPYGLKFNDDGSYQLYRDPYEDNEETGVLEQLEDGLFFTEVNFNDQLAVFNEQGGLDKLCLPEGTWTGQVMITDGTSDSTKVEVTFLSGRIRETNR